MVPTKWHPVMKTTDLIVAFVTAMASQYRPFGLVKSLNDFFEVCRKLMEEF